MLDYFTNLCFSCALNISNYNVITFYTYPELTPLLNDCGTPKRRKTMRDVFPVKYYKDEGFVEYKIELDEEDL